MLRTEISFVDVILGQGQILDQGQILGEGRILGQSKILQLRRKMSLRTQGVIRPLGFLFLKTPLFQMGLNGYKCTCKLW